MMVYQPSRAFSFEAIITLPSVRRA